MCVGGPIHRTRSQRSESRRTSGPFREGKRTGVKEAAILLRVGEGFSVARVVRGDWCRVLSSCGGRSKTESRTVGTRKSWDVSDEGEVPREKEVEEWIN